MIFLINVACKFSFKNLTGRSSQILLVESVEYESRIMISSQKDLIELTHLEIFFSSFNVMIVALNFQNNPFCTVSF